MKAAKRRAIPKKKKTDLPAQEWLAGGGALADLVRDLDWSKTPIGPISNWPQSLKTSLNLILNSRHPMWIGWGPEATFLYNDAYIEVLSSAKHPWALGKPAAEVWAEIWDICGPLADQVFSEGKPFFMDEVRLFMNRGDFLEETYYSFSYSPIRDESGKVAGLFCPSTEVTPKVINARRLRTLSQLSSALVQKTAEAACEAAVATLSANPDDIPFALLYMLEPDGRSLRLAQTSGVAKGVAGLTPLRVDVCGGEEDESPWSLAEALLAGQSPEARSQSESRAATTGCTEGHRATQTPDQSFHKVVQVDAVQGLPLGLAKQALSFAMVLPVSSGGDERAAGVLVAGINPARKLDREYETFLELVAGQIGSAIQNARAVEEERKRLEALAEIDRAKTTFFSNVSHEFRTPLTLMLGPVEELLARSHTDLSPDAKSQLELANRNGSRLLRLVNTLLDFSRIEAGRMQATYQATDLGAFTAELASAFRSATEKAGLTLELDCPTLSEPVFVDRGMWEKIVLNLISNAFKFTFAGKIAVSLRRVGEEAELRVRDTGVGIPAKEIPHLFDRFHRVENARSRTHEGSGIGLALVQELVKLHGGLVCADSAPDAGSVFIVRVPLGTAHLPADRIRGERSLDPTVIGAAPFVEQALRWLPDAEPGADNFDEIPQTDELTPVPCPPFAGGNGASEARPLVLVADDNADMRQYLARLLRQRYVVQLAGDGEEALKQIRERHPDLVLSDVMMPRLDGFGLVRELRSNPMTQTIPVLLLSARAGEEARVEGIERGADDYLIKPFSARELLARVHTHLAMSRVRKESEEALRRRTDQFETLLNQAPMGVYVVDENLRVRAINPVAAKVFQPLREVVGLDFAEVVYSRWPKDRANDVLQKFRHTLATGEPYFTPEMTGERTDVGVRQSYEWQLSRIALPEGGHGVVCYFRDISHQIAAREAIAESEKKLRLATEAAELGIWRYYPEGDRAVWDNERMYEIFRRTREEGPLSAAEFAARFLNPDDREKFNLAFRASAEAGERFALQTRVRRSDGVPIWVEYTGRVEEWSDGKPSCLLGTLRDITASKQAEQDLLDSEDRLRLAQRAAHSGSWDRDLVWGRLILSPELRQLWGLDPSRIGDPLEEDEILRGMIFPEDLAELDRRVASARAAKIQEIHYDFRIRGADGVQRWLETKAQIFYDGDGKPVRVIGVSLDITERKKVEETLRRQWERFDLVAKGANVGFWFCDLPFEKLNWDPVVKGHFGLPPEAEVTSEMFFGLLHSEDRERTRAAVAQSVERGAPYEMEYRVLAGDGAERWIRSIGQTFCDDAGIPRRFDGLTLDITQRRQAEENYKNLAASLDAEIRARTNELEERNAEVILQSELLRDLSSRLLQAQDAERRRIARELHDSAGQVLAALGMSLGQIAQRVPQEAGKSPLSKIVSESQELVQQLNQEIRTMSYLLHPPLLEETGLMGALHWYVEGLMKRSGLEIGVEGPAETGRLPREMELVMFRLVQECLTNIHRHSGSKSAVIRLVREVDRVGLEVEDHGQGMPPETLARIQSQGSGVGIRGMRERARQFGGSMRIESNQQGTKIAFSFPLQVAAPAYMAVNSVGTKPTETGQFVE